MYYHNLVILWDFLLKLIQYTYDLKKKQYLKNQNLVLKILKKSRIVDIMFMTLTPCQLYDSCPNYLYSHYIYTNTII